MNFPGQEVGALGVIAACSLCMGLLVNELRPVPLPWVYRSPRDRLIRSVQSMSTQVPTPGHSRSMELDEVEDRVASHHGVIVDARPSAFYRTGHVPGAINLPRADFENVYPKFRALIEPELAYGVVVYCSEPDCQDAELVAEALARLGYQPPAVFRGGWEEWSRAGLPQETAPPR